MLASSPKKSAHDSEPQPLTEIEKLQNSSSDKLLSIMWLVYGTVAAATALFILCSIYVELVFNGTPESRTFMPFALTLLMSMVAFCVTGIVKVSSDRTQILAQITQLQIAEDLKNQGT